MSLDTFENLDSLLDGKPSSSAARTTASPRWRVAAPAAMDAASPVPDGTIAPQAEPRTHSPATNRPSSDGPVSDGPVSDRVTRQPNDVLGRQAHSSSGDQSSGHWGASDADLPTHADGQHVSPDWMNAQTASMRGYLLMGTGALVGVSLAIGIAGWVLSRTASTPDSAAATSSAGNLAESDSLQSTDKEDKDNSAARRANDAVPVPVAVNDAEKAVGHSLPRGLSSAASREDRSDAAGDGHQSTTDEGLASESGGENTGVDSSVSRHVAAEQAVDTDRVSESAAVFHGNTGPKNTVQEEMVRENGVRGDAVVSATEDDQQIATVAPIGVGDELAELARWLNQSQIAGPTEPSAPSAAPPKPVPVEVWQPELLATQPTRSPPPAVPVEARLKDPVAILQMKQVPLHLALRALEQLSTIPIRLDPLVLARADSDSSTAVDLLLRDGTIGDALTKVIGPLGLSHAVTSQGQLIVTTPAVAEQALLRHRYQVADLCDGSEQDLTVLTDVIHRLIARGSWVTSAARANEAEADVAGKIGTIKILGNDLEIEHFDDVHHQLERFFERLRLARGLPPQDQQLAKSSGLARAKQHFVAWEKPISLRLWRDVPLSQLAAEIESQADVDILIDWVALHEIGWSPASEAKFFCDAQPLRGALQQLLTPRGLGVRVINRRTLEITSVESLLGQHEVAFFPVADGEGDGTDKVTELSRQIATRLGSERMRPDGDGDLVYDIQSGYLILSLAPLEMDEAERVFQKWQQQRP